MSMTLSSMRIAVEIVVFIFEKSSPLSVRCATRFTEPRLHTAISSPEVFRVISVHRLELCTTPTCCCGLLRLQGSLNVIHGCPVSKSIESILRHRCVAGIFLKSFSSPLVRSEEHTSELQSRRDLVCRLLLEKKKKKKKKN